MASPRARDGKRAILAGRDIVPGVAYPVRLFSQRASIEELWAPLDVAASPSGQQSVWKTHRSTQPGASTLRRFAAYLGQARSFYVAASEMAVLSRPLAAYYALLNLAKAWLTLRSPSLTAGKLMHGASDAFESKQRYWFTQETFKAQGSGVFPEIAKATGIGHAYANGQKRTIAELAPYLPETLNDYEASIGKLPSLLPLKRLEVFRGHEDVSGGKTGVLWMRAQIDGGLLGAREMGWSKVGNKAHHFGSVFTNKASTEADCATYESEPVRYGRNTRHALPKLVRQFDESLIHVDRTMGGGARYYLVLSTERKLLSQEAVTFAVMHHLSNMVRYRPEQVERVAAEQWSWLLSTWVPRALENVLLTYSSRILGQEFRLGGS